ncbi:MAG: hypothetical protein JXM73_02520 [Anaerolineae bacterium]|nr:hypothetical protein [Anaerolineae bacterium]
MVNPDLFSEQSGGRRANLVLIGCLLASMVQREVAAGRWYVDNAGCAHPVDGIRPDVIEYSCDKPVLVLQEKPCYATPER